MKQLVADWMEGRNHQKRPDSPLGSLRTHFFIAQCCYETLPFDLFIVELILVEEIDVLNILFCFRIVIFSKVWNPLSDYELRGIFLGGC